MLLTMAVGFSGPAYALSPGDTREFPDDEARRLIAAGIAMPVVPDKVERAIRPRAAETRKRSAA